MYRVLFSSSLIVTLFLGAGCSTFGLSYNFSIPCSGCFLRIFTCGGRTLWEVLAVGAAVVIEVVAVCEELAEVEDEVEVVVVVLLLWLVLLL